MMFAMTTGNAKHRPTASWVLALSFVVFGWLGVVDVPIVVAVAAAAAPTDPVRQPRIYGGTPVTDNTLYPYYAFPAGSEGCGATLVHEDVLLTAAHCQGIFTAAGVVVGGVISTDASTGGQYRPNVIQELVHPDYADSPNFINDIMLIKISEPVTDVEYVQLNTNPDIPIAGTGLTIIGYGATETADFSEALLSVDVFAVSQQDCNDYYGRIQETIMMCSGGIPEGGKDACSGDSGGPVFANVGGTTFQVGIVSFADGCGKPDVPGVNVRVSTFVDWIEQGICDISDNPPSTCFAVEDDTPVPTDPQPMTVPSTASPTASPTTTVPETTPAPTTIALAQPTTQVPDDTTTTTTSPTLTTGSTPAPTPMVQDTTRTPTSSPNTTITASPTNANSDNANSTDTSFAVATTAVTFIPKALATMIGSFFVLLF